MGGLRPRAAAAAAARSVGPGGRGLAADGVLAAEGDASWGAATHQQARAPVAGRVIAGARSHVQGRQSTQLVVQRRVASQTQQQRL